MTSIEIQNPSAWHNLRIASQDRVRNTFERTAAPTAAPKRVHSRVELEAIGSEITTQSMRISTKFGSEMRNIPTPFYRIAGFETLNEFITESAERELRESQKAAAHVPPVQHVVDEWSAPKPFASIAPGEKLNLPLDEAKRFLIESDDEVALQLSNVSSVRTIRLRNRDMNTGEVSNCAFLPPAREFAQAALVIANKKSAACIELMPS
ncbi:MAG: hypothetical protein ACLP0B_17930 [Steroidobacteraceae bacterium]|jgi:hypothetical protein